MKSTFSLIVSCGIIFCFEFTAHAQDDYNAQTRKFWIDDSTDTPRLLTFPNYIFEGIVIKSTNYFYTNDGRIVTDVTWEDLAYNRKQLYGWDLTSYTVLITKVFRGHDSLKLGTVEIICNGVWYGGAIPSRVGFSIGYVGIFLCRNTNYHSLGVMVDNPISLQLQYEHKRGIDIFYPGSDNVKVIHGLGSTFKSIQDIYFYLQRQPNITLTDTKIHPVIKEYLETGKLNIK